jgi:hypothetical protein
MVEDNDATGRKDSLSLLDFETFSFPSDNLTLGDLRRRFPTSFDRGFGYMQRQQPTFFLDNTKDESARKILGEKTLHVERLIAVDAFLEASEGTAQALPNRETLKKELADSYISLGLAKGRHHAAELINQITSQSRSLGELRRR